METILQVIEMIIGVVMVVVILLQHKGAGLGAGFGGGGGPITTTRRGVDLFLHKITIGLAIAFFGVAFATIFV